jgi:hypothetical protein
VTAPHALTGCHVPTVPSNVSREVRIHSFHGCNGAPPSIARADLISAGIYGGGGFFQFHHGLDGLQLLQGALEFDDE